MSDASEYSLALNRATVEMNRLMALPENIKKDSWVKTDPQELLNSLDDHVNQLKQAIADNRSGVARLEAANIANFAWMAADSAAMKKH